MMAAHARDYPGYGWETNRGYGTPEHYRGLESLGVTPLHRRSFAPVQQILARDAQPELQLHEMAKLSPASHTTIG
jgi:ribonuclease HII